LFWAEHTISQSRGKSYVVIVSFFYRSEKKTTINKSEKVAFEFAHKKVVTFRELFLKWTINAFMECVYQIDSRSFSV